MKQVKLSFFFFKKKRGKIETLLLNEWKVFTK